jgi:ribosomal-protein-alanine N-acetyltransferase
VSAEPIAAPARWRVRPMSSTDLPRVLAIEREIYPFPWTAGNFGDSLKAGYEAWVFENAQDTIGYAVVMWIPDEVHLLNISVAGPWQGRGYGRAMLEWLCEDAGRRGARTMLLEVRPSNDRARAMYETAGFVQIGLRKRYYPSYENTREDALVLQRRLAAAKGEPR